MGNNCHFHCNFNYYFDNNIIGDLGRKITNRDNIVNGKDGDRKDKTKDKKQQIVFLLILFLQKIWKIVLKSIPLQK